MTIRRLGSYAGAVLGVALTVHVYALVNDLYFLVPWLDIPMHFFSGVGAGLCTLFLAAWCGLIPLDQSREVRAFGVHIIFSPSIPWWWSAGITLSIVAVVGLAWEVHEIFLLSLWHMPIPPGYIFDTLKDLTNDALGGIVAWRAFRAVQLKSWSSAQEKEAVILPN